MSPDLADAAGGYARVPAIGEPGRAASELPAGRPPHAGDSADHEISACSVPGVEVRAASVRGLMHRYREEPRQDRFALQYDEASGTLLVVVCDGVGAFGRSHEAAGFVARWTPHEYLRLGSWAKAIEEVNQRLTSLAEETVAAGPTGGDPDDARMATTFVGAAITAGAGRYDVSIAWSDDSPVWALDDGAWTRLTVEDGAVEPELHTGGVRALPHARPRIHTRETAVAGGAIFVMTDGVGLPLEAAAEVRDTLAGWWASPPDMFSFARQVGFARKSHMDDRTVVGAWFVPERVRSVPDGRG